MYFRGYESFGGWTFSRWVQRGVDGKRFGEKARLVSFLEEQTVRPYSNTRKLVQIDIENTTSILIIYWFSIYKLTIL